MDWGTLGVEVFKALLPIVIPVIVGMGIAWIKRQLAEVARKQPDLFGELTWIAEHAVNAAEQAGASGYIKGKKNYALNVVQMWLDQKGIRIDANLIDAAIEAAVRTEINRDRPAPSDQSGKVLE